MNGLPCLLGMGWIQSLEFGRKRSAEKKTQETEGWASAEHPPQTPSQSLHFSANFRSNCHPIQLLPLPTCKASPTGQVVITTKPPLWGPEYILIIHNCIINYPQTRWLKEQQPLITLYDFHGSALISGWPWYPGLQLSLGAATKILAEPQPSEGLTGAARSTSKQITCLICECSGILFQNPRALL